MSLDFVQMPQKTRGNGLSSEKTGGGQTGANKNRQKNSVLFIPRVITLGCSFLSVIVSIPERNKRHLSYYAMLCDS